VDNTTILTEDKGDIRKLLIKLKEESVKALMLNLKKT